MLARTQKEISILKEGGKILASILKKIKSEARPNVSAKYLDERANLLIIQAGGESSFKNYKGEEDFVKPFPASLCVSINNEVVHGIPEKNKILKEGDIASFDLGMKWPKGKNGLYVDSAFTMPIGKISYEFQKMIDICEKALDIGISCLKTKGHIGDTGEAIQRFTKASGFNIIANLVGHGVGHAVHEEPLIPNWGKRGRGEKILKGMVLAIEPMITTGAGEIVLDKNNWTWKTKDNTPSAHFEHTILVEENGAVILTK